MPSVWTYSTNHKIKSEVECQETCQEHFIPKSKKKKYISNYVWFLFKSLLCFIIIIIIIVILFAHIDLSKEIISYCLGFFFFLHLWVKNLFLTGFVRFCNLRWIIYPVSLVYRCVVETCPCVWGVCVFVHLLILVSRFPVFVFEVLKEEVLHYYGLNRRHQQRRETLTRPSSSEEERNVRRVHHHHVNLILENMAAILSHTGSVSNTTLRFCSPCQDWSQLIICPILCRTFRNYWSPLEACFHHKNKK